MLLERPQFYTYGVAMIRMQIATLLDGVPFVPVDQFSVADVNNLFRRSANIDLLAYIEMDTLSFQMGLDPATSLDEATISSTSTRLASLARWVNPNLEPPARVRVSIDEASTTAAPRLKATIIVPSIDDERSMVALGFMEPIGANLTEDARNYSRSSLGLGLPFERFGLAFTDGDAMHARLKARCGIDSGSPATAEALLSASLELTVLEVVLPKVESPFDAPLNAYDRLGLRVAYGVETEVVMKVLFLESNGLDERAAARGLLHEHTAVSLGAALNETAHTAVTDLLEAVELIPPPPDASDARKRRPTISFSVAIGNDADGAPFDEGLARNRLATNGGLLRGVSPVDIRMSLSQGGSLLTVMVYFSTDSSAGATADAAFSFGKLRNANADVLSAYIGATVTSRAKELNKQLSVASWDLNQPPLAPPAPAAPGLQYVPSVRTTLTVVQQTGLPSAAELVTRAGQEQLCASVAVLAGLATSDIQATLLSQLPSVSFRIPVVVSSKGALDLTALRTSIANMLSNGLQQHDVSVQLQGAVESNATVNVTATAAFWRGETKPGTKMFDTTYDTQDDVLRDYSYGAIVSSDGDDDSDAALAMITSQNAVNLTEALGIQVVSLEDISRGSQLKIEITANFEAATIAESYRSTMLAASLLFESGEVPPSLDGLGLREAAQRLTAVGAPSTIEVHLLRAPAPPAAPGTIMRPTVSFDLLIEHTDVYAVEPGNTRAAIAALLAEDNVEPSDVSIALSPVQYALRFSLSASYASFNKSFVRHQIAFLLPALDPRAIEIDTHADRDAQGLPYVGMQTKVGVTCPKQVGANGTEELAPWTAIVRSFTHTGGAEYQLGALEALKHELGIHVTPVDVETVARTSIHVQVQTKASTMHGTLRKLTPGMLYVALNLPVARVSALRESASQMTPHLSNFVTSATRADVNGDAHLDVIATTESGFPNKVFLNPGDDDFTSVSGYDLGPPGAEMPRSSSAKVTDINGDGVADVIVGNVGAPNSIFLGDGNTPGIYEAPSIPFGSPGDLTKDLAIGDVDGDGVIDIVAANEGQRNKVYYGDPSMPLSSMPAHYGDPASEYPVGHESSQSTSVTLSDLNADGTQDIILGNFGESDQVILSDGNRSNLAQAWSLLLQGTENTKTRAVAAGDVTGDGVSDILLGVDGGPSLLVPGRLGGSVIDSIPLPVEGTEFYRPTSVELIDVNADGDLDAVFTTADGTTMTHQNEDGSILGVGAPFMAAFMSSNAADTSEAPATLPIWSDFPFATAYPRVDTLTTIQFTGDIGVAGDVVRFVATPATSCAGAASLDEDRYGGIIDKDRTTQVRLRGDVTSRTYRLCIARPSTLVTSAGTHLLLLHARVAMSSACSC